MFYYTTKIYGSALAFPDLYLLPQKQAAQPSWRDKRRNKKAAHFKALPEQDHKTGLVSKMRISLVEPAWLWGIHEVRNRNQTESGLNFTQMKTKYIWCKGLFMWVRSTADFKGSCWMPCVCVAIDDKWIFTLGGFNRATGPAFCWVHCVLQPACCCL